MSELTTPLHTVAVLLGLDGRDDTLIDAVHVLAGRHAMARVLLVHVGDRGTRPASLDRRIADVAEALPGVKVQGIHATGRAEDEVARLVVGEQVDLVILGRTRAEGGQPAWGEHGLAVLRTADCPVLLVPDDSRVAFGSALVGMDFSENALEALRLVSLLCDHVRPIAVVDPNAEGESEAEAREGVLDAWRAKVVDKHPDETFAPLEVVAAHGPADALLYASAEVDLLVVGSRGLTPLAARLLGSTAERLGGRCNQPLLVYRNKGTHRGVLGALFGR